MKVESNDDKLQGGWTHFRAEFKYFGQTLQPVAGVRVRRGLDKPNPYPYPRSTRGTYPRVSQTRDNP